MSYTEFKKLILFHYHKDIRFWYSLVGEMFENTQGFTEQGKVLKTLDKKRTITWNNYSWNIQ